MELTAGLSGGVPGRQDSTSPDGSSDADEVCVTNSWKHMSMNRQKSIWS